MGKRKLKPVLSSLKEKKRYLAFTVLCEAKFGSQEMSQAVDNAVMGYIGALGKGEAGVWMLADSWDYENQTGLIRMNNRYVDEVKASLVLTENIGGREVAFKSLGLSGILNKAKRYTIAKRVI